MSSPLIDTDAALAEAVAVLAQQETIALDTEADSLHSYFEKLCLVQISIPEQNFLIDPLAGMSLEPLFQVLAGRRLILHGADYDLRLLRRVGFTANISLFDTMIAARLSGLTEFSLAALILRYFEVQLTKASQKANWARRPLSPQMVEYAINDTRFLLPLSEILTARLVELGRWSWFEQSCERAIQTAAVDRERDPEQAWRISGSAELRGRATAILRELWRWREQEAQLVDKPAFHILHNELLIDSALRFEAGDRVDIAHLRGSRRQRFFEAGEAGRTLPEDQWPKIVRKPRLRATAEQEERFRVFRKKRDAAATELQLDPSLIAPKSVLEGLSFDFDATVRRLMPWQRELLGLPEPEPTDAPTPIPAELGS